MRPRTTVTLLEPATTTDPYTGEARPNWTATPTEHPDTPAAIEPLSSTEATLTAETVISRWVLYLPAETTIEPSWRVRWRGDDFDVDGEIQVWEGRRDEAYRSCLLKLVEG